MTTPRPPTVGYVLRPARRRDILSMRPLMEQSIGELLRPFLPDDAVAASFEIMGIDTQLIEDGTYFAVEDDGTIVGCGGWSRAGDAVRRRSYRRTRCQPVGPGARRRPRPRHVHPSGPCAARHWPHGSGGMRRRGRSAGFNRVELVATLAGEPLYRACGYQVVEERHRRRPPASSYRSSDGQAPVDADVNKNDVGQPEWR